MSSEPARPPPSCSFARRSRGHLPRRWRADPRVILLGQDVGSFGGSYKEFLGLLDRFGAERVRDTPVAEAAMVGLGVGAAAAGLGRWSASPTWTS